MRKIAVFASVVLFVFASCSSTVKIDTESGDYAAWKTPRGSFYNSASSIYSPEPPYAVVWEKQLPNPTQATVVAASTILIVTDDESNIYCLNQEDGSVVWSRKLSEKPADIQPIIGVNTIFCFDGNSNILCLDVNDGSTIWSTEIDGNIVGWPIIDGGKLWFVTESLLYCVEETKGTVIKTKGFDCEFTQPPSLQRYLYLVAGNKIIAVDDKTYNEVWSLYFQNDIIGPIACVRNLLYVVDGRLFQLDDTTGAVIGSYKYLMPTTSGEIIDSPEYLVNLVSPPAVYQNVICVGTSQGTVIGLNEQLQLLWSLGVTLPVESQVTIGADKVYFGGQNGKVYVGSVADGRWLWHNSFKFMDKDDPVMSAITLLDNRFFAVSVSGIIKRFDIGGEPMTRDEMIN
ncbi:MAG TPA: PQQ-like beta-propeller repeat protein [Caldisericia bacterium]|nr:PQQ-like beta-propeller repeat protein [Caldisericia bacterium]HPF49223.1 PQQ-like beta-propeller repeat protein [Caldisericia bacterium]HPI84097.1 PQQ-like beta-propeller repeat protein [Caldisericia bacterium]HPQ93355.1 PQQ-like beta-propeller repeat protein [Caldisericia bacterium]HRV75263.1 PQQ-like beta-propeller repeat protein [Caldisericia bacterium]